MINKTVHAIVVGDAWDAFMTRKVLTTTWETGFVAGQAMPIRFPPLQGIIAALLYMELVSMLDDFCASQMTTKRWEQLGSLHKRINALAAEGKTLDPARLHGLRDRRNEIAHRVEQSVEVAELDEAIATVRRQLEAWKLIGSALNYEPFAERSAWKDSARPGYIEECHWTVGVKREGRTVMTVQWDELLARDE